MLAVDLLCSRACSAPCQERNWESRVNSSLPTFSKCISSCTGSYLLKKGPLFLDRLALQAFQTPRPPSWWLLAAVESSIRKTVLKNSCGSFLQKQFSFSLGLFSYFHLGLIVWPSDNTMKYQGAFWENGIRHYNVQLCFYIKRNN